MKLSGDEEGSPRRRRGACSSTLEKGQVAKCAQKGLMRASGSALDQLHSAGKDGAGKG